MARIWRLSRLVLLSALLAACAARAWERDPNVQAAQSACKGVASAERYACVERHAVQSLSPDVCRLLGIGLDDACLQSVYEAADDPAICDRLYLEGVRPTCRAYYAKRAGKPWVDVLFTWNRDGAAELWTIDPVLGAVQRQVRPNQVIQDPALSPSGETIVYVRVTGDYGGIASELWLMDRDGANPRSLYVPPPGRSVLHRPAWQPDGLEVYFLQQGSGAEDTLLRTPVGGGEPTAILTDCLDFALSPDGERLVSVNLARQLTVSSLNGTMARNLEPDEVHFSDYGLLAASPDGALLAFRATEQGGEDTWNLYTMDWDGRNVQRLTDLKGSHPLSSGSGQVSGLAWAWDGRWLVYSVDGQAEQGGIWLADLRDRVPVRLFDPQEGAAFAVQGPWPERP